MNAKLKFIKCLLGLAAIFSSFAHASNSPPICEHLGINLAGVAYWSSEAPFVDLMKMSGGWVRPPGSSAEKEPLQLDAQGNPLSIAPSKELFNVVHDDLWSRTSVERRYMLTWQGDGVVVPSPGPTKTISTEKNQVVFDMTRKERIWLLMKSTSATNLVRDLHLKAILPAGQPMSGTFRKPILENWSNMRLLRFMDWGATNNSTLVNWADRSKPEDSTQSGSKGVAYEYMIELANQSKSNPWINIPHAASDDYIRQMARKFRDELDPSLTVYVEYTNEAWNGMFAQFRYLDALGKKNNLKPYEAYVDRALQVNDIWRKEFGRPSKLKFLLAGQFANSWLTEQMLKYKNAGKKVDGFAIGYYVGGEIGNSNDSNNYGWLLKATPKEVIQWIKDKSIPNARKLLAAQSVALQKYGLPLMAYEAGQHLIAVGTDPMGKALHNNQQVVDLLIAANREPGMSDVYRMLLEEWQRVGGREIALFSSASVPTKWGSWGLKENEAQSIANAPKLRGIYEFCGWQIESTATSKSMLHN